MFPKVKLRGTLRLRGNKAHCFLQDLGVMKCFVIPPNSKIEKMQWNRLLDTGWLFLTNLLCFQGARPDHVRVESSIWCFPGELVSFVPCRKLVSFDQQQVTRSPPIGKHIWVEEYNNCGSDLVKCRCILPQCIGVYRYTEVGCRPIGLSLSTLSQGTNFLHTLIG